MKSAREAAAEAAKAEREYEKSITGVSEAAASASKEELARLQALYRAAVDEARSKEERIEAARRLCNRSIPIIFPKCRPNKSCWETPKPNTMN